MFEAGTATEHYAATLDSGEVVTSNVPWVVTYVAPRPNFQFSVRFIDGTAGEVEMREMIFGEAAGVFHSLRDPDTFARLFVDDGVVTWANGLDLAPDAMHDEIARNGVWVLR